MGGVVVANGGGDVEVSRKRLFENVDGFGPDVSNLKYKRRKVSANRDFPNGCGRFAPQINVKPSGNVVRIERSDAGLETVKEPGSLEETRTVDTRRFGPQVAVCENVVGSKSAGAGIESTKRPGTSVEPGTTVDTGRFAAWIDVRPSDNVAGAEVESAKHLENLVETRTVDGFVNSEQIGLPNLVKTSSSCSTKLFEDLDQANVFASAKIGDPVKMEIPKALDQVDSCNRSTEPEGMELHESLRSVALDSSLDVSQLQEEDMPSNLIQEVPSDSCMPVSLLPKKVFEQHQLSVPSPPNSGPDLVDVEKRLQKKYPTRRRVSAYRDFPQGCGRNARPISCEEHLMSVAPSTERSSENEGKSKDMEQLIRVDSKQTRALTEVQGGDAFNINSKGDVPKEHSQFKLEREPKKDKIGDIHIRETSVGKLRQKDAEVSNWLAYENLSESDLESPSIGKKVDKVVRNSVENMKLGKETSLKRKFPMILEDNNNNVLHQFQREDSTGLATFNDRVIVQALMAAPNCPWRQGKRSVSASKSTAKSKAKSQFVGVQEEKDKTVSLKGKATKKNMYPTGEAAVRGAGELVLKNDDEKDKSVSLKGKATKKNMYPTGEAAVQCAGELILKNDETSSGNDEENVNVSLVPRSRGMDLSLIPFGLRTLTNGDDHGDAVVTRNKVRETLRLFQAICRKFLQDEEAKSKNQVSGTGRIDLKAAKILKVKNKYVNNEKQILGPVPGVEVGDQFHYRVELTIIGLHRLLQGGIDWLKRGSKIVATSIVASGGYDNDTDGSDVLVYSGQGGHPTGTDKKAEDQKLERGNLALKNSMDERTPVRVIRGFKEVKGSDSLDARGKIVSTLTYDGLYLVEKYWIEKGRHGNNVFMFQLRRIHGQPELTLREVKNSNKLRARKGLCVDDISQGKEKMPICAVNTIDDSKPPPFDYITKMIYPSWYNAVPPKGCDCTNGCSDSMKCFCAVKNGGELPFNHNGAIVEAKPLVYECGPSCRCPPSCRNRVSQKGIKFQLEIFKTESRGWGVRSVDSIPSGSFICEYTGELLQDKEAEQRTGNDEYLFDIGHNYKDGALWDGLSTLMPPDLQSSYSCETVEDVGFTIDAAQYGNIGRFINHSCSPNLYAQNVLYDHDDKRKPHIMLFAAENIPPLQELTYHYNYELDQVQDCDGNIKKKDCYCGSLECTGRMY